jgi:hypothetical protein
MLCFMVAREAPDNESLRLELQEAIVTYRHNVSQLTQVAGIIATADVVLLSYGFSQRLAAILLAASVMPIFLLAIYLLVGSLLTPLISLILRFERRLLIRKDSIGAAFLRSYIRAVPQALSSRIEDLSDKEVQDLKLKWDTLWAPIPIILYAGTVVQIGLFVLSLTVFHYRFM